MAVQVVAGTVIAGGGSGVSVASSDLDVAETTALTRDTASSASGNNVAAIVV